MAFTQITTSNLDNTITTKLAAAEAANAAVANIVSLAISSVQIADSSYNVLDDTAANTGGGYLVINGTGFTNQCVVIVGTTNATSTTFANTKQLRAQVPGLAAATYPLYVVDSVTGATAIKVNGLTYSSFPAWSTGSTLSNQAANTSFSVNLSATSDSSVTYSNTTALPAGTTLAANGLFSGTVTIGAQTTYSFDVKATDTENQDVSRTFSLTVTVMPQGRLYAWGFNASGQTGLNNRNQVLSPSQVGSDATWSDISAEYQSLGIKSNGTLWAIGGRNNAGQLGLNDTTYRSSPVQVGAGTTWSKVTSGPNFAAALKTDGTLWTWGWSYEGILGLNVSENYNRRSSPTQVGTETTWSKISNKSFYFYGAIKTNGTLWLWGAGTYGLGTNDRISRSSPVQIGAETNWRSISTGRYQVLATKTDGTLWAWGLGRNGPLNSSVSRSSPVQVGTGTDWNLAVVGQYSALATKTDGTLWSWGNNVNGACGLNTSGTGDYRSSPTQVGSNTNWNLIEVGVYQCLATKTDSTLWYWGSGSTTPFGNQTARSSPTQVGAGTDWKLISLGSSYQGFAVSST